MKLIEIGPTTKLRIPDEWTAFVFNGFLYVKGEDGRFVARAKVGAQKKTNFIEESA